MSAPTEDALGWPVEWTRAVHKHQHTGDGPGEYCPTPWSGLCQSDWGTVGQEWGHRICWASEFRTQPEALAALEAHLREGACDPDRDDDGFAPCGDEPTTPTEEAKP